MKGLEDLKEIFKDKRLYIGVGQIKKLHLAEDRAYLKVTMMIYPEMRNVIATMTWDSTGPNSGDFEFPAIDDMVLFAQAEGDDDQCYVIRRLTSRADTIPENAIEGDKVSRARAGGKYWNVSDTKIFLARGEAEPTQNLVLGQVFKQLMTDLLTQLKEHAEIDKKHVHMGNLGFYTAPPKEAAEFNDRGTQYDNLKASPVQDQAVLSDLSFTEK